MVMRDKIIKMIDVCLVDKNEYTQPYKFDLTELQSYIKSDEYSLLKAKRYYDDILKQFISILGLRFTLYNENLTGWYKSSDNQPVEELDRWEELINGTNN
jgi:hypothetical protein